MIEFFPFNADLNRLTLKVAGVGDEAGQSHLGTGTKHFSAKQQFSKGINLAEEFLDNPFCEPFRKVEAKSASSRTLKRRWSNN